MYSFYYIKAKYADRCTLLFTDTDSLCCEILTDDLYADMMESLDLYDTSNFDPKFHSIMTTTAANSENLRARPNRSLLVSSSACARKCIASGPQQELSKSPKASRHENFLEVLRKTRQNTTAKFCAIRSTNQEVNTVEVTKLCLCAFDDKRYILDEVVHTLAYGHNSINSRN